MRGCCRRTRGCICLIYEVHSCDQTVLHREYMEKNAVRKNLPLKALDELVNPDAGLSSIFLGYYKRFDIGIELASLSSQILANLLFSDNLAAL